MGVATEDIPMVIYFTFSILLMGSSKSAMLASEATKKKGMEYN